MKRIISLLLSCLFIICCFVSASCDSYKASIGSNMYTSLQEAIEAAADGAIIKLLDNCDGAIIEEKIITIDLNGKTITGAAGTEGNGSSALSINGNSEVEIKGPGKIVSSGYYDTYDGLLDSCIENSGVASLTDVELETENATCILNFGDVTIKRSKLLSVIDLCIVNNGGSINIISGQFSDNAGDCVSNNVSSNSVLNEGDLTYPFYVKEKHFVTYHVDGVVDSTFGPYYVSDTCIINKEDPTKDGYKFVSWNTKEDGSGSEYKKNNVIVFEDKDIDLYAIWIINDNENIDKEDNNVVISHKIVPNTYAR